MEYLLLVLLAVCPLHSWRRAGQELDLGQEGYSLHQKDFTPVGAKMVVFVCLSPVYILQTMVE